MRVYNPEGSTLRRDQMEMLTVLNAFAEICKDNDIQWWLCSGTLLGAARHGGFIPWDDDIDVSMFPKDYRKLLKVMKSLDSDEYFYQCIQTDVDHINVFGKFRKKKGCMLTTDPRSAYFKYSGVSIDVFPIEKTSRFADHMAKFFYHNMMHPTIYIKTPWLRHTLIRLIQAVNFGLIFPIISLIGLINPKKDYHCALGSGFYDQPFHAEDILPLTTIEFEGCMFPAPKDTDMYLKRLYGDWRRLPTDEQIRKSMHSPIYIEEIFGK